MKDHGEDNEGPEISPFMKVDQLLPETPGETPEDRANDIDNVLTWIRNHDTMDVPDDTQEPFKKLASIPMPGVDVVDDDNANKITI